MYPRARTGIGHMHDQLVLLDGKLINLQRGRIPLGQHACLPDDISG